MYRELYESVRKISDICIQKEKFQKIWKDADTCFSLWTLLNTKGVPMLMTIVQCPTICSAIRAASFETLHAIMTLSAHCTLYYYDKRSPLIIETKKLVRLAVKPSNDTLVRAAALDTIVASCAGGKEEVVVEFAKACFDLEALERLWRMGIFGIPKAIEALLLRLQCPNRDLVEKYIPLATVIIKSLYEAVINSGTVEGYVNPTFSVFEDAPPMNLLALRDHKIAIAQVLSACATIVYSTTNAYVLS